MILATKWGVGMGSDQEPGIFLILEYAGGEDTLAHFHGASRGLRWGRRAHLHIVAPSHQVTFPPGPTTDLSTGTPATAPPPASAPSGGGAPGSG